MLSSPSCLERALAYTVSSGGGGIILQPESNLTVSLSIWLSTFTIFAKPILQYSKYCKYAIKHHVSHTQLLRFIATFTQQRQQGRLLWTSSSSQYRNFQISRLQIFIYLSICWGTGQLWIFTDVSILKITILLYDFHYIKQSVTNRLAHNKHVGYTSVCSLY